MSSNPFANGEESSPFQATRTDGLTGPLPSISLLTNTFNGQLRSNNGSQNRNSVALNARIGGQTTPAPISTTSVELLSAGGVSFSSARRTTPQTPLNKSGSTGAGSAERVSWKTASINLQAGSIPSSYAVSAKETANKASLPGTERIFKTSLPSTSNFSKFFEDLGRPAILFPTSRSVPLSATASDGQMSLAAMAAISPPTPALSSFFRSSNIPPDVSPTDAIRGGEEATVATSSMPTSPLLSPSFASQQAPPILSDVDWKFLEQASASPVLALPAPLDFTEPRVKVEEQAEVHVQEPQLSSSLHDKKDVLPRHRRGRSLGDDYSIRDEFIPRESEGDTRNAGEGVRGAEAAEQTAVVNSGVVAKFRSERMSASEIVGLAERDTGSLGAVPDIDVSRSSASQITGASPQDNLGSSKGFRAFPQEEPVKEQQSQVTSFGRREGLADFQKRDAGTIIRRSRYSPPQRGPVHLERPVSLEVRPKPRQIDYQADNKVRVMACTDTIICTAADDGFRAWNLAYAMDQGSCADDGAVGDEDAAAAVFRPVLGARILCLTVDRQGDHLWSGHADGAVRVWPLQSKTQQLPEVGDFILEWQAHRQPVTALTISSYGELWTGAEGGSMRVWPWEALTKALADTKGSGFASRPCLWLAGAGQDLSARPSGEHSGNSKLHSVVRFLLADHANCRIWSGGLHNVAIWDARQREVVKVVGPSSQFEFPGRTPASGREKNTDPFKDRAQDSSVLDDEISRGGKSEDKDKNKFWRIVRSSAVRPVRRLGALAVAADGSVWVGYANGLLQRWDKHGSRLEDLTPSSAAVCSMVAVGTRIWVGYADRKIAVFSGKNGRKIGGWEAHKTSIAQLAVCGDHVVSLAAHGGLRAWSCTCPSPMDALFRAAMADSAELYTKVESIRVVAATWNVGEGRPSQETLQKWLSYVAQRAGIVAVGLQEMETGAGTIALAAAKDAVGMGLQEIVSANANWWLSNISTVLGENKFVQVAWRQLAGMLIGVWVLKDLTSHLGEVETGAVGRGFGRALGNKGAVAVRMSIYRRTVCIVSSHLAAHQEAVGRRNEDWLRIYHRMVFGRTLGTVGAAATSVARVAGVGVKSAVQGIVKAAKEAHARRGMSRLTTPDIDDDTELDDLPDVAPLEEQDDIKDALPPEVLDRCDLAEADLLVWMGDFNYRLDNVTFEEAIDLIQQKRYDRLLKKDQLMQEMSLGRSFQGMREAKITFPPTYKFDRGERNVLAYDSSEKRRVPAWCDRVLLRDSSDFEFTAPASLSQPIKATFARYEALMEAVDSDHKPVRCVVDVNLAVVDEAARRKLYGHILYNNPELQPARETASRVPQITTSPRLILLDGRNGAVLRVTNEGKEAALFCLQSEGQVPAEHCVCGLKTHGRVTSQPQRLGRGFPSWLQLVPAAGVIPPEQTVSIDVLYADRGPEGTISNGLRGEAAKDNSVLLVLETRGGLGAASRQQRICVCHGEMASRLLKESSSARLSPATLRVPSSGTSSQQAERKEPIDTAVRSASASLQPPAAVNSNQPSPAVSSAAQSTNQPATPPVKPPDVSFPDLVFWD